MGKIVINSRFLTQAITGSQRFAIEISKQLRRLNSEIVFVAPKDIVHKDIAEELKVKTIGINTGHVWEQIDLPLYLKKVGNPLLVNLVNTAPLFYKNKIVTIHDISWKHFPDYVSKKFYWYYRFLIPRIAKNSRHIFTVSEFSKNDLIRNLAINKNKISVIYNAVGKEFKHKQAKKEKIILSVASLHPLKNIENLVEAFFLLKKNHSILKNYILVLIGVINSKVFSKSKVLTIMDHRPDIIFTGYISAPSELATWYNRTQIFVLPSKFESFGIPPLEAMACGTPVVVSKVAGLPEVCGDAAYYVNPYDVDSIAEGIYKVLIDKNLRGTLIQKGLKRVKLFSWEKSAKKLIEVIERIL